MKDITQARVGILQEKDNSDGSYNKGNVVNAIHDPISFTTCHKHKVSRL